MELEFVLCILGGLVIGITVTLLIVSKYVRSNTVNLNDCTTGLYQINTIDPEKEYMSMHLNNMDELFEKEYVILKIVIDNNA